MNKETPIPVYYQISREIIEQIKLKKLVPGDKISSENEIIKAYSVSNTTARKVIQEIELGGFVQKIRGKGTYVRTDVELNRSASKVLSFNKNMLQQGITPRTQLLECSIEDGGITKTIQGRNYVLPNKFCKIKRLRFVNNKQVLKEIRYISIKYCPGINKLNLEDSLYNI